MKNPKYCSCIEEIKYEIDGCSIDQAIDNLKKLKQKYQGQYERLNVSVEIEEDYGGYNAVVCLSGVREKTQEDFAQEAKRAEAAKQRELELLESLKEKYEKRS